MHIVHLLTRLLRAGSEENTLETCRWQIAQGHRVSLIHGAASDPYWWTGPRFTGHLSGFGFGLDELARRAPS
ncbi:hypothetical protein DSM109990_03307 (plasmid) [Sulfitobacter dubius]|uniref:Uncharacterized protein n=1 Tax=Sulfitobacter dubius TaxID=218673 RepID=A0ABY3ZPJ0_9RHOB|nr:hypothetical protein DSM109990_03307 [Sulfitobacter dubius]